MLGLEEAFDRIGAHLESRMPYMHAAGAALAVTDREDVLGVVVRGFADAAAGKPVRPETRMQIGSISKSFSVIVALQLAAEGRLDLDSSITDLAPWIEVQQPFGPITLRHLLTHSSGLPIGSDDPLSSEAEAYALRHIAPGFAPGSHLWYSNIAYDVAGAILEHLAGQPIHELIAARVFEPLGMTSSVAAITNAERTDTAVGYSPLHDDRPVHREHPLVPAIWTVGNGAAGAITSNVTDMCAYARAYLNGGAPVLDAASFEEMTTVQIEDPEDDDLDYGLGLWVGRQRGTARIRHSGGMVGYTALFVVEPEHGLAAVMLVNGWGEKAEVVDFALDTVRAAILGESLPDVEHPADPASTPDASAFAGTYRAKDREIELIELGDRLVLQDASTRVVLERNEEKKDRFLVPHADWERFLLTFVRDEAGEVDGATHGTDRFRRNAEAVTPAALPDTWHAYLGAYRSHNPWGPFLRIVGRDGSLVMAGAWGEDPLVALPDGSFRVGAEDWHPGRIGFDQVAAGVARRATMDGGLWYRTFESRA